MDRLLLNTKKTPASLESGSIDCTLVGFLLVFHPPEHAWNMKSWKTLCAHAELITNTRAQLDFLPKQLKALQPDRFLGPLFLKFILLVQIKMVIKDRKAANGFTGAVGFFLFETHRHHLHQATNFWKLLCSCFYSAGTFLHRVCLPPRVSRPTESEHRRKSGVIFRKSSTDYPIKIRNKR